MTMMGGWICFCSPELGSGALLRAQQIGCTKTTAMEHLRMSRKKRGRARSDGHVESASEITITMVLMIFFVLISVRMLFTASTAMVLSPMCPRLLGFAPRT